MVIYLKRKRVLFKLLIFTFSFIVVYSINYLKYDDSSIIYNEMILKENMFLKKELSDLSGFKLNSNYFYVSKVLYRDVYSFYDEIVISNKDNNIKNGDAVVNENGLVGIVYKYNNNVAYAKLLTSDYNVSVMIGDVYGNLNNGVITMLNKYSDIKVGDLVYTSGFGEVEKGLLVGKVSDVSYDKDKLGKEVLVELIDNDYLNYVGIVRKIK